MSAASPLRVPWDAAVECARRLDVSAVHVRAVSALLVAGSTVPFIARYRRNEVGGLTAEQL